MAEQKLPEYSNATLILTGAFVAAIIGFVVYAKMEDDRIYGPVREAHRRVEEAERNLVDVQRQVAMDSMRAKAEASLARIDGRPAPAGVAGPAGQRTPMSMNGCLTTIAGTSEAIGMTPRMEINRSDMRVATFEMADGTIRITCADGEQIVTHQPR